MVAALAAAVLVEVALVEAVPAVAVLEVGYPAEDYRAAACLAVDCLAADSPVEVKQVRAALHLEQKAVVNPAAAVRYPAVLAVTVMADRIVLQKAGRKVIPHGRPWKAVALPVATRQGVPAD